MIEDIFDRIYKKYLKINKYLAYAEFVKFEIDEMQEKYGSPFYDYRVIKTLALNGKYSINDITLSNFELGKKGWHSKRQAINSHIKGSKDILVKNSLLGLQIVQKHDNREKYRQRFELTPYGFVLAIILFTGSMWHRQSFSGISPSTKTKFFGEKGIKKSREFLDQCCKRNQENLPILTDIIKNVKDDEDALLSLYHFWGNDRSRFDMELEHTIDFYQVFRNDEKRITARYYYYLMESSFASKETCTKLKRRCEPETLKFIKAIEKYVELSTEWLECSLKLSQIGRVGKDIPIKLFEKRNVLSYKLTQLKIS